MTTIEDARQESEPLTAWVRRAACAGRPAMFDNPERMDDALRLCARCPVLTECRLWALTNAVHGVAGGMTEGSRTAWRETQGMPEPVVSIADFFPLPVLAAGPGLRPRALRRDPARGGRADGERPDRQGDC